MLCECILYQEVRKIKRPWVEYSHSLIAPPSQAGWDDALLTAARDWRRSYEPVFVLRKKDGACGGPEGGAGEDESP